MHGAMRFAKHVFLTLLPFSLYSSDSNSWTWTNDNGQGDFQWNESRNWSLNSGFPNAVGAQAIFPQFGNEEQTIGMDSGITIGNMTFNSEFNNYSFVSDDAPAPFNFSSFNSNSIINVIAGTHTIATPIFINSPLTISNSTSNPFTINNGITGANSITIQSGLIIFTTGAPPLVTTEESTYTGKVIIASGTNTPTLQLDNIQSLPKSNPFQVNGTLALAFTGGTQNIASLDGSGTVDLGSTSANTLNIQGKGAFSGSIKGEGNVQISTNTVTLSGSNIYEGTTTITSGSLNIAGSIENTSSVTVDPPGTLTGTGIIGTGPNPVPVTNSGTVKPGNSPGTLTINGDYTQTGNLLIEINDQGESGLLDVSGIANLTAPTATLTVAPQPGIYEQGSIFTFMNYNSLSAGSSLILIENPSLDFVISFLPNSAILTNGLKGAVLPVLKQFLSGNQRSVADYLFCTNFLPSDLDLLSVMSALVKVPANQFPTDLVKLSPAQVGALPLVSLHSNRIIADVIVENTERFDWCKTCEPQQGSVGTPTSVWVSPVGYYFNQDGIQEQVGFNNYAVGVGAGISHLFFNALHVGGGVGYTYSKIDWDQSRGDGNVNSVYLGPSFGWSVKDGFLNLLVMGAYNHYAVKRKIQFPGINRTATNHHDSYNVLARLDGGYKFRVNTGGALDHLYILPKAKVSYLNIFEEGYTESGADSINLSVDSKYSALLQPSISVTFLRDFYSGAWCIMPAFQIGWVSNIWLSSSNYTSKFHKQELCEPHFVVKSYSRNTNQLSMGLDVNLRHTSNWVIDFGYRVDFLDNNYVMDGKIKLKKLF